MSELTKYARHEEGCVVWGVNGRDCGCSCGLIDALDRTAMAEKDAATQLAQAQKALEETKAQLSGAWVALEVYGRHVWPCDGFTATPGNCPCSLESVQRSARAALEGRKP